MPTFVPTDYIPDLALRIQLYRRMADLNTEEKIADLAAELADRFGPLPPEVENLALQLRVKLRALQANVESIVTENSQLAMRLPGLAFVDRAALQRRLGHGVRVSRAAIWLALDHQDWRKALLEVLARLSHEKIRLPA